MTPPRRARATLHEVQSSGATTAPNGGPTVGAGAPLTLTSAGGILEAGFVPAAGMLGCSLRHRGVELLGPRAGVGSEIAQRSGMGIPLLHPWANRLRRRRFPVAGRMVVLDRPSAPVSLDEHGLPIHGLLASADGWAVERHDPAGDSAALRARFAFEHGHLLAAFPFPHELDVAAALTATTLTVVTTVHASRASPVPIAFGHRLCFRLPGVARADWHVELPVAETLVLDGRRLPTGERSAVRVAAGRLAARTFDDAYVAPEGGEPFVLEGGGRRIEVRLDEGYRYAQLFAPGDDEVIALEPMTAPTDALVAGGPELLVLAPGQTYRAAFSITVT